MLTVSIVLQMIRTHALFGQNLKVLALLLLLSVTSVGVGSVSWKWAETFWPYHAHVFSITVGVRRKQTSSQPRVVCYLGWGTNMCRSHEQCAVSALLRLFFWSWSSFMVSRGKCKHLLSSITVAQATLTLTLSQDLTIAWSSAVVFDTAIFSLTLYRRIRMGVILSDGLFSLVLRDGEHQTRASSHDRFYWFILYHRNDVLRVSEPKSFGVDTSKKKKSEPIESW